MKILIVDDREENLYLLEALLKGNGHKVVSARNGIEALNELKKGSIDMIISDILMPKMDGYQLCRECKSNETLKKIPFIFYTATYTDKNDEEFALKLGAEKFIVKPVEPDMFINIIRGVVRNAEEGKIMSKKKKPALKEKETFKLYSERLVKKLEEKMLDLEISNKRAKELEERYRIVFENTGTAIVVVEKNMIISLVNTRFERLSGYSKDEIENKMKWTNFIIPEDLEKMEKYHIARRKTGGKAATEYEFHFIDRKGNIKDIFLKVGMIPRTKKSIASLMDITERKEAEKKLWESEERFQQVAKNAQEWVWETDVNGLYTYASPVVKKILGYKPEEVVGKKHFYDLFHPEDREKLKKAVFELIDRKQPVHEFINRNVRKGGEIVWLSTSRIPILDKKGNVLGYRGADTDITERIKAERELKYINLILYAIRFVNQLIVKEKDQEKLLKKVCNNLVIDPIFKNVRIAILDDSYRIFKIFYSNSNKETAHKLSQLKGTKLPATILDILLQQEFYLAKDLSPRQRKDIPLDAKAIDETVVVPLKYAEKLYGFLNATISEEFFQDKEVHSLLKEVSGDISFALHNIKAEEKRKQLEEELKENFERWQNALNGTIQAIAMIAEKRDPYTAGHQRRVAQLSSAIAQEMNLSSEKINTINMAAAIHDIGKISVPVEILVKPTKLTAIEFDIIKAHPQTGYDIVKNIDLPWPIAKIILQHHERINGSGYPQGLSGKDIMLKAKIIGVADVVEAMSSYRPYRPALGIDKALEEIEKNKGILYDPEVVDVCIKLFREKGFEFKKEEELS